MAVGFDVQVVRSASEVKPDVWDQLGRGQPFASQQWYCFCEASLAAQPFHILLRQRGELIARATLWLMRREQLPIQSRVGRAVVQGILQRWPLLACRTPLIDRSGLVLPPGPRYHDALATVAEAARRVGRQSRASFVLFDYLDQALVWPAPYQQMQIGEPSTRLDIQWADFEQYTSQWTKSMRKDYHRHTNRANDLGIEIQAHSQITHIQDALPLIRQVERQHQAAPNLNAQRILEESQRVPHTWLTATIQDRLVGCGLLLGDGDARMLTLLGLDYNIQFVYFQLLYAAVRAAIESGAKTLYGGSGANSFKERLGFTLWHNNQIAVSANQWFFREVAKRLA
ncbi:MAG TPA: peptidogalycan biosysnthesis protein [Aggregatilineaceae bacterium]|nr:peptidogalycan biosysnthesis protein [Aggregatilineaceae bacterium]